MSKVISNRELINSLTNQFDTKSAEYMELLTTIEHRISITSDEVLHKYDSSTNTSQYDQQKALESVISLEYLFFSLRTKVTFESIQIKQIVTQPSTTDTIKSLFLKRGEYLSSIISQLREIREEVNTLQRLLYLKSTRTIV